jgi:hypothetical protein
MALVVGTTAALAAQQNMRAFGRERRVDPVAPETKAEYDGRFSFMRLRYGGSGLQYFGRGEAPWHHDFPRADFHFLKIIKELTFVHALEDQGNVMDLDDPDMSMFPIAYMSEPGFWTMDEGERDGLRAYLQKGGFIIFDDFRGPHLQNLHTQMRLVLPDASWVRLDPTHPIFHSFFEINTLDPSQGFYGPAEWFGIFEDNDSSKRLMAIANYNHDLGELWEFSDTGYMPVDLTNDAYKFGVNYVVYAMTH